MHGRHVASRVADLPSYVQAANDMRRVSGEGVAFLNIPRTYYGLVDEQLLIDGGARGELLSAACPRGLAPADAAAVVAALRDAGLVDAAGALALDADDAALDAALDARVGAFRAAPVATRAMVRAALRRSVYVNLWRLLGETLDEPTYLKVVRNQILIDVQGDDVLMQIFTSTILQREPGAEAPCPSTWWWWLS